MRSAKPTAPEGPTTVLVSDPQPLFRDAVARVVRQRVDLHVIAELDAGRETLAAIRVRRPAVAVLAAHLPELSGWRVARAVTREQLPTVVLILADPARAEDAYQALACGVRGFLSRTASAGEVADAIVKVAAGQTVMDPAAQSGVAQEIRLRAAYDRPALSPREQQVLERISAGRTAAEIGRELHLGTATVKTHTLHLYQKLDVSDRAAAVAQAMRRGLLE